MRIAAYHNLPSGGAKRSLYESLKRLSGSHQIDVFTLSSANHTFCDVRPFCQNHNVFEFSPYRLFKSPFGRLNQVQRWRDLLRLDTLNRTIASQIDANGYDLVYVNPCLFTQAPSILQYLHTRSIYYVHESLRQVYEAPVPRPYLNRTWRQRIDAFDPFIKLYRRKLIQTDRASTLAAGHLLVNSRFTAQNIQNAYGRKSQVVYFAVDTDTFYPQKCEKQAFVLSVGALRPNKGFDFLIESLAQIPSSQRPPLQIIGNADDEQERTFLTNLAHSLQVQLIIETMVDLPTLVRRYNQAQMVVYTPVREPFGLVPLEAMACAVPVVGVAEGGVTESVVHEKTGLLTERNPQQFAQAVVSLLTNPAYAVQLGSNARQHVLQQWTWQHTITRLEEIFQQYVSTTDINY